MLDDKGTCPKCGGSMIIRFWTKKQNPHPFIGECRNCKEWSGGPCIYTAGVKKKELTENEEFDPVTGEVYNWNEGVVNESIAHT